MIGQCSLKECFCPLLRLMCMQFNYNRDKLSTMRADSPSTDRVQVRDETVRRG